MSTIQSLLKNTFFNVFTNLLNRISSTLLFIFIIQRIAVNTAGVYDLGISYFLITSRLALFGLGQLLARDVAADRSQLSKFFSNFLLLRLLLTLTTFTLSSAFIILSSYDPSTKIVIIIFLVGIFPENVNELCSSVYVSFEKMHLGSISTFVNALIKLVVGFIFVLLGYDLTAVAIIILAGHLCTMIINLFIIKRYFLSKWHPLDLPFIRHQLPMAYPFIIIGTFYIMDNRIDKIFLSFFKNEEAVGVYGAATTIIVALGMFAESYRDAILPIMARFKRSNLTALHIIYSQSFKLMLILGLPLSVATVFMSEKLVFFLYKRDLPVTVLALQIMGSSIVFLFTNGLCTRLLLVFNQQHVTSRYMLISTVINIIMLFWLIPQIGVLGAAISTAVANTLRFILLNWATIRLVPLSDINKYGWRLGLSITTMGLTLWLVSSWAIWWQTLIGSIVYLLMLFITKTITIQEQKLFIQLAHQLKPPN